MKINNAKEYDEFCFIEEVLTSFQPPHNSKGETALLLISQAIHNYEYPNRDE